VLVFAAIRSDLLESKFWPPITVATDVHRHVHSRFDHVKRLEQSEDELLDDSAVVRRNDEYGNPKTAEILLVINMLIGRDKDVELLIRHLEQHAVLCS
jgi:hypothetical protein